MRIIRIGTSFLQFIKNKIRMIIFWSYQTEYENFQVPEKISKFLVWNYVKHLGRKRLKNMAVQAL